MKSRCRELLGYSLVLASLAVLGVAGATAQCASQWLPGESDFESPVSRSMTEWDPDGGGPLPPVLVLEDFNGVYTWDGSHLQQLGPRIFDVRFVMVHQGTLYVGKRGDADTGAVLRWNGTYWEQVGGGFGPSNAYVQALLPFENRIIAAGNFTTADGGSANSVAAWNGIQWQPLGLGLQGAVNCIASYQGSLVAAGSFTNSGGLPTSRIARWDGTMWQSLGDGLNNTVNSIAILGQDLYATGSFTASGTTTLNRIARWDGSQWLGLASGLSGTGNSLMPDGSGVIVSGLFSTAGTSTVSNLARWNGQTWGALSTGLNGPALGMLRTADRIYMSGNFTQTAGRTIGHTASWDGQTIRRLFGGFNDRVDSLVVMNGDVILGGNFTTYADSIVSSVARWNNGNPVSIGQAPLRAEAMAVYNGELYAAGPGRPPLAPSTTNNVWKWNGSSWTAVSSGADALISRLIVYHGELIAGGQFRNINGVPASMLARYNGTTWRSLAGGLSNGVSTPDIFDMTIHNDRLIVTGTFMYAPGVVEGISWHIAQWDGNSWSRLGNGSTGSTRSFIYGAQSFNGALYVCGSLYELNGVSVRGAARWTGTTFEPIGVTDGFGRGMCIFHGRLVFAGGMVVNGVTYDAPVAWDGQNWETLGTGIAGSSGTPGLPTMASVELDDRYFIAGEFLTAGGEPSSQFAVWREPIAPAVSQHPQPSSSCNHHPVQFSTQATGTLLQYRWEKDLIPIDTTQNPSAATATLSIAFPSSTDSGMYACRVTNDCNSLLSDSAALLVCEADFNCDSALDFFDYLDFVTAFATSDINADFNGDSIVDFFDYLDFVDAFSAGC